MVAISPTNSTALALLQQTQRQDFRSPLAFLTADIATTKNAELDAQLLDTFAKDVDLRKQFVERYDRIRGELPGITDANAANNAMVQMIMENRDRFPAEGFILYTDFPEGGSVATIIPPKSGDPAATAELERTAAKWGADRAIEAQIAEAMARAKEENVEPPDPQEIRDRLTALYLARWS
ncbi:MAG TPA: hypothetical protein PK857_03880 [Hyphomicrobium sp.]|nr:hypothetical protein [Hyphomicrobium sp.]